MKLTKSQLRQIIKEELSKALNEANWWEKPPAKPKKDPFSRPRSGAGEWWSKDGQEPKKDPFETEDEYQLRLEQWVPKTPKKA